MEKGMIRAIEYIYITKQIILYKYNIHKYDNFISAWNW